MGREETKEYDEENQRMRPFVEKEGRTHTHTKGKAEQNVVLKLQNKSFECLCV